MALLGLCLVLLLPQVQGTPAATADRAELSRLEGQWNTAHLHGDANALDELWADDLSVVVPRMAPISRAGALGMIRSGRFHFDRYETSRLGFRVYGDAAVVTGRLQRTRRMEAKTLEDDWQFTKVYVRQGGRWRVVAFQASESPSE